MPMARRARHVLVIEDDAETAEQLVDALLTGGYRVDLAVDGEDGLRRGLAGDYVVMTVDRMLPHLDGIKVIRRLREKGILTPALILSALGEIDDRVRGLRAGAVAICIGICLAQSPVERGYWIRLRGQSARRRACVSMSAIRRLCAWRSD